MLKASASAVSGPFIGCSLLSCLARLCLPVPRNLGTAHRGQPPIVSGSLTVQGQVQDPSGSGGCPAGYHCPHRSGEWASEFPVFQSQGPAGHRKQTTATTLSEIFLATHCPTRIIFPRCTIAVFIFLEKGRKMYPSDRFGRDLYCSQRSHGTQFGIPSNSYRLGKTSTESNST